MSTPIAIAAGRRPLTASIPVLTSTVPSQYVHRAAIAEVLLTSWHANAADDFSVTAQWPRCHSFYTPVAGQRCQDPMLGAETVRQAGLLLAHAEYGVPLGHQFLVSELSYETTPEALRVSSKPTDLELRVTSHDIVRRGDRLSGMRYEVDFFRDGVRAGSGQAKYTCTSPSVYRRLRADRVLGPLPELEPECPAAVGRTDTRDVVLSPLESGSRQLRVDLAHPALFDHPLDHVPGMLLLEAARQAALAASFPESVLPVGLDIQFLRYAELDQPCAVSTDRGQTGDDCRTPIVVTATQAGEAVFTATVIVQPVR
jgi:2-oxo-3-(phosphooxy)propyl 3-oxoalkanoate synthase